MIVNTIQAYHPGHIFHLSHKQITTQSYQNQSSKTRSSDTTLLGKVTRRSGNTNGRVPLTLCEPVRKILRRWQDIKVAITKWDTQFLRGKPPRCEKEKPRDRSPLKNPLYKWYEYNHVLPVQLPEQNIESSYKELSPTQTTTTREQHKASKPAATKRPQLTKIPASRN